MCPIDVAYCFPFLDTAATMDPESASGIFSPITVADANAAVIGVVNFALRTALFFPFLLLEQASFLFLEDIL